MLEKYSEAMQLLRLEPATPLYVASGIFKAEPMFGSQFLASWSKHICYGRLFLSAEEVKHLDLEQLAAIDFLVASRAQKFIGWAGSSFSFWVMQERALNGLDAASTHIIRENAPSGGWHDEWSISNAVYQPVDDSHDVQHLK